MKTRSLIYGMLSAGCALGVALPARSLAAVSDEDFEALKKMVQQLSEKVQYLEQTHQVDQQAHQQDQQKIQQLQQQVDQTQQMATNAVQKVEAASQVQPIHPIARGLSALHNFTLVGDAEVQYGKYGTDHGGFGLADFAPVFLYRANDNVLAEVGFDTFLSSAGYPSATPTAGSPTLTFATLDYMANDYLTMVAGDMILPLGTYNERSAGWLNKFPDAPLPYMQGILPSGGMGVQFRGSVPVADSGQMLTYAVYGANGPTTVYSPGFTGLTLNGDTGFPSLNSAPSAGGRIGWFIPFKPHYDLELGISGESGERANYGVPGTLPPPVAGSLQWSGMVFDAALHVSPYVEVKGEYMYTWVDTTDPVVGSFAPRGWWVQAGYKLAGLNLDLPVINNLEPV
ncbi:MAG: hypothetical protein KGS61_20300, partial [Verrucomicrobia bacterium]|nr:hypothetical protein [Verrucomicrobiota bacterium]